MLRLKEAVGTVELVHAIDHAFAGILEAVSL